MNIEIGEIYYLCTEDGTGWYIKPITNIIGDFLYYLCNKNKDFKGFYIKTQLSLYELKKSILIHNKDFDKYPDLCGYLSKNLNNSQYLSYKRQLLLESLIDNI